MRSPLHTFAGLLDRSVQEIAALSADARAFDCSRIGRIADIWDNNTFPLLNAACAPGPLRDEHARAGLLWMAALGPARRQLMVDLDASLHQELPAATAEPSVVRDYRGCVRPGFFPVTAQIINAVGADYDLANASVRSIAVRPAGTQLQVDMTVAAPRRFVPSMGRVARDGSRKPWPPAPLHFRFLSVRDLRFDATDRIGLDIVAADATVTVAIGRSGTIVASSASVWPDDPMWHESAAGRAADSTTPHERPDWPQAVPLSLTPQQQAAARALMMLMVQIRLVSYYPDLAATVPVREICRVAAGAGSAVLTAGAKSKRASDLAFAELVHRWRPLPAATSPTPIPSGSAMIRYLRYDEPHEDDDDVRAGGVTLVTAAPETDPTAPWRLASEELTRPARFRVTTAAFTSVRDIRREAELLTVDDDLVVQANS
ncbi:hypothetical protein AB0J82_22085 [Asanoa sp. NPDC049518]|uniref:hypothetical protein n=1 Tax=unclassified Asanoa TaxID=2685164 RepID=UPI0034130050